LSAAAPLIRASFCSAAPLSLALFRGAVMVPLIVAAGCAYGGGDHAHNDDRGNADNHDTRNAS
jgi:hypothetical protein